MDKKAMTIDLNSKILLDKAEKKALKQCMTGHKALKINVDLV